MNNFANIYNRECNHSNFRTNLSIQAFIDNHKHYNSSEDLNDDNYDNGDDNENNDDGSDILFCPTLSSTIEILG